MSLVEKGGCYSAKKQSSITVDADVRRVEEGI